MSDEHNARMLGAAGHPVVQTPHLDALAARGARFTNASCNVPICVPSRASFATGRYAHAIGAWDNAAPYTGQTPSWGHRLTAAGHAVTTVGKLHYRNPTDDTGFPDQRIPMHVMHGQGDIFGLIRDHIPPSRHQLEHIHAAGPGESEYIRYDTAIAGQAAEWLHTEAVDQDRPWCLFVSFTLPHFPLIVPAPYFDRYPLERIPLPIRWQPAEWPDHPHLRSFREARIQTPDDHVGEAAIRRAIATYFGMCTFLDDQIGRVVQALASSGHADRTRIIYTSDHGEMLGDYGCWGKSTLYDSAVAVPFIMAGPDVPAGTVIDANVSLVDCFPSILDAVGVPLEAADADLPGTSLWPAARGEAVSDRLTFAEYHATGASSAAYMLRGDRYKYNHFVGYPPQLFDLQNDPEERHDLAPDPPPRPLGEGRGEGPSPSPAAIQAILLEMEADLRARIDPEGLDRAAKADQRRRLDLQGGEAAIRAAGPQINFTRAPEEFR